MVTGNITSRDVLNATMQCTFLRGYMSVAIKVNLPNIVSDR